MLKFIFRAIFLALTLEIQLPLFASEPLLFPEIYFFRNQSYQSITSKTVMTNFKHGAFGTIFSNYKLQALIYIKIGTMHKKDWPSLK